MRSRPDQPSAAPHRRRRRRLALSVITGLLALATVHLASPLYTPEPLPVLDALGGDFRLPSTLGSELSLEALRGELVLLNFGYTACPEVCPTVLARLRALLLDLESLGIEARPLFVTLDPERDDLAALERYLAHFHPDLVGLRGTPAETAAVAERYQVYFQRETLDSGLDYGFVHSTEIYLIDSHGRVRATLGGSVPLPDMVSTVRRLAREEAS